MVQELDGTVNEWGWCKQKVIYNCLWCSSRFNSYDLRGTHDCTCTFQLGANAILAVSLAVCKAGASVLNIPLYKVGCFPFTKLLDTLLLCAMHVAIISSETRLFLTLNHSLVFAFALSDPLSL